MEKKQFIISNRNVIFHTFSTTKLLTSTCGSSSPADAPVDNSLIFHGFLVCPPNQMSSYPREPGTSFATKTAPEAFNLNKQHPFDIVKLTPTEQRKKNQ